MTSPSIVVTGLGILSPLGEDVATFWSALECGRSAIGPIRAFDATSCPVRIAAELPREPRPLGLDGLTKLLRRSSRFGVTAALDAVADAQLNTARRRGAVYVAALPSELDHDTSLRLTTRADLDVRSMDPVHLYRHLPSNVAYGIACALHLRCPSFVISSACAAGAIAIGEAFLALRRGECDWALAGGTCAPITPLGIVGLALIRALTTRTDDRACCPFDATRSGFVLGEGAAMLVLERADAAAARGARAYGAITGYGASMDGYAAVTDPDPSAEGAVRAMRAALDSARCPCAEVDCIKAHGTSTRVNDRMETRAIRRTFGARAGAIPVTAPKSMLGHSLTAAGAMETVVALGMLQRQVIPPTINYAVRDPECDLDYVPNVARRQRIETVLAHSFGLGGQNAALVLCRYPG